MRPTVSKSGRVNRRAEWAAEMPVRRVVMYSPVHQGLENAGVGLVEQDVAHHYGALLAPLDAVAADHLHHGQVAPLIDAGHDVVIVAILLGDVDFGGQGVAGLFPQGLVHPADELAVRSLGCNGPDGFKIKYFRVFSLHFHLSSLI